MHRSTTDLIDVWDVGTFDAALVAILRPQAPLVLDYINTDNEIFLQHDYKPGPHRPMLRPENPHAARFYLLQDAIASEMEKRTIRAWHYTRLTDAEVAAVKSAGAYLSTPASLRRRLSALVSSGLLSNHHADAIFSKSPIHHEQHGIRSGMFWMISHPLEATDSGVVSLLEHWGGEVAYCLQDETLVAPLTEIGTARVVELAVPMAATEDSHSAARAVVASFGRSLGCIPGKRSFDLCARRPLGPDSTLAVHSQGDTIFPLIGRTYPTGFVDVDVSHWKELTGEDS